MDAIKIASFKNTLVNYNTNLQISKESVEWLIDNVDHLVSSNEIYSDVKIANKGFQIEKILIKEPDRQFDSYENRVIAGFLSNLIKIIIDKEISSLKSSVIRNKATNFREFLILCFNNLLQKHFKAAKKQLFEIDFYLQKNLPVTNPLFEYPKKIDGFYSKTHYRKVLELINYSRKIFSLEYGTNDLHLEIESFDKLFEIYCFYLIRDIISENLGNGIFTRTKNLSGNSNNKLSGEYSIDLQETNLSIKLYYEMLPSEIVQFTDSKFNPDFVISVTNGGPSVFIIIDAKYKQYNGKKGEEDLSLLAFKYLHKIGIDPRLNSKVIGLFTVSLSRTSNRCKSIHNDLYTFTGENAVIPQIGNIELDPKTVRLQNNSFLDILKFGISYLKEDKIRK